jgi:large subunit ribosomal protein L21
VYAIVRCGGRQEKATVDDVLTVDTLAGEAGSSVTLPALLVVDDGKVISDPAELSRYQVTAEIVGTIAGPKINMIHFRNKTGYRRRLGHRQRYTQVKITSIAAGRKSAASARRTATGAADAAPGSAGDKAAPTPPQAKTAGAKAAGAHGASAKAAGGKPAGASATGEATAAARRQAAAEQKD